MTATELHQKLNQQMDTTEAAVAHAIGIYIEAGAQIDAFKSVQNDAKTLLDDIIIETGQDKWQTAAGSCQITKPSLSVSYDAKALDALCKSDSTINHILAPHRKETERAGTLRVTRAK